MIDRTTRLRWRRRFRRSKNQVEDLGVQAEEQIERHFFKRLSRLADVRRFVLTWIVLAVLLLGATVYQFSDLSKYYQTPAPVAGGTYTEGILGAFTNANPIYATGAVDSAVSRLVFAGLFKYDAQNKLVGDLAEKWEVDAAETTYTVTLKRNILWQDNKPLKARDVVFTYKTIQNPDAKSPLFSSWQGINIQAKDDYTVVFTLPSILSAFPYSLTTGIIPEHLLATVPPAQMRGMQFNTAPVGAGPFSWDRVEVSHNTDMPGGRIGLNPNQYYYQGKPALSHYVIQYFADETTMIHSFENHELTAMSGVEALPDTFKADVSIDQYNVPLTAQIMVFFRNSQEILKDVKVRQALVQATDQQSLLADLGFPAIASKEPFLQNHPGYNPAITQLAFNRDKAAALLSEAGWVPGADGIRMKDGKPLTFNLYSQSSSEYAYVTQRLQQDWQKIGVKLEVLLQPDSELQNSVTYHSYDALLYGISLGPDPDIYAYWGSSQADERATNRVNFSEYRSAAADSALQAGRTRADPALRAVKYKPFLEAWRNDAPALALYQPRYLYVTRDTVYGLELNTLNVPADRYGNVSHWMIHTEKVRKI